MKKKDEKRFNELKNAIDALINRQRQIMKLLKPNDYWVKND